MDNNKTKVYYYKFNPWVYVFTAFVVLVDIAFAVVTILKLVGVGVLYSYYRGLDVFSLVVNLGVIVFFILNLTLNRYIVSNGTFVKQRFIKTVIPVEKMLTITKDEETKMTVLYYADEKSVNDGISFVILSVRKIDELIEDIRALNPHVSVDTMKKKGE